METIKGTVSAGGSVSGTVKMAEKVKELFFSSHLEFPGVGKDDRLYIAVDENSAYRFDANLNIYVRLNGFDAIQSRLREE